MDTDGFLRMIIGGRAGASFLRLHAGEQLDHQQQHQQQQQQQQQQQGYTCAAKYPAPSPAPELLG